MNPVLSIRNLNKTYKSGFAALNDVNLDIEPGEIFALLGPNGAGKTTLINVVCGIVTPSSGTITVAGHDVIAEFRHVRSMIGLVPQELTTDAFESVWNTVTFSRGLFGRPKDSPFIEQILKDLSLFDKRKSKIMELSGGMKRRVMIAKALSHEPDILFLDEPSAGVDVELRRDMWKMVRTLRDRGVTIILTTHYIEEAEEMADRVGVISKGRLLLVEEKSALMKKLGRKTLTLHLLEPMTVVPPELSQWELILNLDGSQIEYCFDTQAGHTDIPSLLRRLAELGVQFRDLDTHTSSLEDIFVGLVQETKAGAAP